MEGLSVLIGLIPVIAVALGGFVLFRKGKSGIINSLFKQKSQEIKEDVKENQEKQTKVVAKIKNLEKVSEKGKKEIENTIKKANKEIEEVVKKESSVTELGEQLLEDW